MIAGKKIAIAKLSIIKTAKGMYLFSLISFFKCEHAAKRITITGTKTAGTNEKAMIVWKKSLNEGTEGFSKESEMPSDE